MLIKLSIWSCLEIKMQDEVIVSIMIKVPLKGWNSSNIWEQPEHIKILFRNKLRAV